MLPPHPLNKNEQTCWDFLIETAVPGVLTKMDSAYVALCAQALAKAWYEGGDGQKAANMLVRMGMTPTERSRVIVAKKEKASRVSGLARKA